MTVDDHGVLDDRYVLDEVIAHGGMATVYHATDRLLLRSVAVKMLREVAEPTERERFIAEARTLASLNHPGLITLLDAGILNDRPYLVLELATGPTLSARIAEGPLDPDLVRTIGRRLAEALAYAHAQGVVHRDVKPSNVLLCEEDRILLADFGIARLLGAAQSYTKSGDTIGSPAYLAPEQVAGEPIGPAADVYALGLVLLEALTAVRAYTGAPLEAAMARLHVGPAIPTHLDAGWRTLIARMTSRDPEDRPSAVEVAAELTDPAASAEGRLTQASVDTGALGGTGEHPVTASQREDQREDQRGDQRENERGSAGTRWSRRRVRGAAVLGLLLAGALAALLLVAPWDHAQSADPTPSIPSGVPSRLQQPLSDLHEAVEGTHR